MGLILRQTEDGETISISGQMAAALAYRWSTEAEPVLKAILRNMTYQKNSEPSLNQNE